MLNIKNFKPRLYQETIADSCAKHNCLVILPTGLGKTKTAILAVVQRLNTFPNSKILFLTVTKPLADQIYNEIKECIELDEKNIVLFTGMISPKKRKSLWKDAVIVVSTPQCIENDLISERINIEDVSLLIVDEAHNAVKNYAYTWIAQQYYKKARFPRIIGLTASPGSDLERIQEVCRNLYIEDIEIRTDQDPDVKPYIQEIDIELIKVELPPVFSEIQDYLKAFVKDRLGKLKKAGILRRKNLLISKTDLLKIQAELRRRAASGERDFVLWNAISVLAEIMKVSHGLELLETQGIVALYRYLTKLRSEAESTKVKAVKNIVKDLNFRSAFVKTEKMFKEGFQHPKLIELQKIVADEIKRDVKIIVFNQYRDNALDIVRVLNSIKGVKAQLFVGQLKRGDTGLSQKEQKQVLDRFRVGEFNILVATSVGEQGLDIPQVNLVIFYEPIPSAIRHIQRRGRTGRHEKGRVIILVTKGTRDESYRWSAHHKEKRMYRNLANLKKKISMMQINPQKKLNSFIPKEKRIKIFADYREKGNAVVKELVELNAELKMEKLDADYVLSSNVGVEFKTISDFVQSIIDGRMLEQAKSLKERFEKPLIIVEGDADIYSQRNIHPNAIRGMLATIAVSYGVPILYTKNFKDTAALLYVIAKREQEDSKEFSMHPGKRTMGLKEMQEYVVSSLPGIGPLLAKELLKQFGCVRNIVNADASDLQKVEKIGKKIAKNIRKVLDSEYV